VHTSLAMQVALGYLASHEIQPEADPSNADLVRLGNTTFPRFQKGDGGYVKGDDRGYQVFLDFRGPRSFRTLSLTDILSGHYDTSDITGRIVLIGMTARGIKDYVATPLQDDYLGVELQGQVVNQFLRAAIDGSPPLRVWPGRWKMAWILGWCSLAGLSGLLIRSPWRLAFALTVGAGLLSVAAMFLAWAVAASPVASAVAMAVVMAGCVLATRQDSVARATGLLLNLVYFYYAAFGIVGKLAGDALLEVAAIGFGTAAVLLVVVYLAKRALGQDPDLEAPAQKKPVPSVAFFAGGPTMGYALARGALIGALAGAYAIRSTHGAAWEAEHTLVFHDVFWVMLTCWVVLAPLPDTTWERALLRTAGVMAGCLVVAGLAQVIPGSWMVAIGLLSLLFGILWVRRNYAVFQATISFLIVALIGEAHGDTVVAWAGRRVVDTLIGVTLSLGVYGLTVVLPRRAATR